MASKPVDIEILENFGITRIHEITERKHVEKNVGKTILVETKTRIIVSNPHPWLWALPKKTIVIHSRSILAVHMDGNSQSRRLISTEGPNLLRFMRNTRRLISTEGTDELDRVIETEMTQEELQRFEEDWSNLWNPQAKAPLLD